MHAFLRSPKSIVRSGNFIKYGCNCQKKKRHIMTEERLWRVYLRPYMNLKCTTFSSQNNEFCLTSKLLPNRRHHNWFIGNIVVTRHISLSIISFEKEPLKPSSKVEETVQAIKDKVKEDQKAKESLPISSPPKQIIKKSLKQRVVDEILHYYHGFRLLFIDIKISTKLCWRVLKGHSLSRREHRLLVRTVGDMFRLLPFSVFIIVPFMEFLLPVAIRFFPGMLPSTFQTAAEKEDKMKQSLKVKLEMAKFLQKTLDDMAVQHKDRKSECAKEFSEWFVKVQTNKEQVTNEEIMKFSKFFRDEITLDTLSRSQLIALCRVLEVQTLGTNNFLRFQLTMKLRSLAADDKMIQKEGVDSLTLSELQQACKARGMRAYGMTEEGLKSQLQDWLDLSMNEKVPPSLLLLSRAMMLPETIPTSDKLKATISALPEKVVTHTKAAIGEREGKIDNKTKIEILKEEERKVQEERREHEEKKKEEAEKEILDKAPVVSASFTPELVDKAKIVTSDAVVDSVKKEEFVSKKDIEALEDALDTLGKEKKKLIVEKEEIQDLKEEMADYQEDLKEFHEITAARTEDKAKHEIKESVAAKRLFKKVNSMITKMDSVLKELEQEEKKLKKNLEDLHEHDPTAKKDELVRIDELMKAIKKIKNVSDDTRLIHIERVLGKIDDDQDGALKVEDVLKVIEMIGKEDVQLGSKQIDELIELIDKEELLEVEDKIEKALQKELDAKATVKALGEEIGEAVTSSHHDKKKKK